MQVSDSKLYIKQGGHVQIPQCDTSCCDILLWMADATTIYFKVLESGEVYQVVEGALMEVIDGLPFNAVLGVLMDDGKVGIIAPNRLQ